MVKISVIGISFRPLDEKAKRILLKSRHILINDRLLEIFKGYDEYDQVKDKVKVINNVDETIDYIRTQITEHRTQNIEYMHKNSLGSEFCALSSGIVLIAEGDPLFFGIGRRVIDEFGKENVEIYPDLSSMQVAFSRIREPWGGAFLISLHGGPDPEKRRKLEYEVNDIPSLLEKHDKVGILTDRENNPVEIAKILSSSVSASKFSVVMYVCERLGYPDERIIQGKPEDIAGMAFYTPNVVIIMKISDKVSQ